MEFSFLFVYVLRSLAVDGHFRRAREQGVRFHWPVHFSLRLVGREDYNLLPVEVFYGLRLRALLF